jgi:hypothetical protein
MSSKLERRYQQEGEEGNDFAKDSLNDALHNQVHTERASRLFDWIRLRHFRNSSVRSQAQILQLK